MQPLYQSGKPRPFFPKPTILRRKFRIDLGSLFGKLRTLQWSGHTPGVQVREKDFCVEVKDGIAKISITVNLKENPKFAAKLEKIPKEKKNHLKRIKKFRKELSEWRRKMNLTSFV
jgi:hypothetical protein